MTDPLRPSNSAASGWGWKETFRYLREQVFGSYLGYGAQIEMNRQSEITLCKSFYVALKRQVINNFPAVFTDVARYAFFNAYPFPTITYFGPGMKIGDKVTIKVKVMTKSGDYKEIVYGLLKIPTHVITGRNEMLDEINSQWAEMHKEFLEKLKERGDVEPSGYSNLTIPRPRLRPRT